MNEFRGARSGWSRDSGQVIGLCFRGFQLAFSISRLWILDFLWGFVWIFCGRFSFIAVARLAKNHLESSMPAVVVCPKCQARYQLPDTAVGKTIECKKCSTRFAATPADQQQLAVVGAQTKSVSLKSSRAEIASRYPVGASAEALARFGLDGPLQRQPDPMGGPFSPPPKDILGNYAADPGFVIPEGETEKSAGNQKNKPESVGGDSILDNPYVHDARKLKPIDDKPVKDGIGYANLATANRMMMITYALMLIPLGILFGISSFTEQGAGMEITPEIGYCFLAFYAFTWATSFHQLAGSLFSFQGHENLRILGARNLRFSAIFAAFSWFIPLGNLVLPLLTTLELTQNSSPKGEPRNWQKEKLPAEVLAWWVFQFLFYLTLIPAVFVNMMSLSGAMPQWKMFGLIFGWISFGCLVVATLLFYRFSSTVQKNQEKMRIRIRKAPKQNNLYTAEKPYPGIYRGLAEMLIGVAVFSIGWTALETLAGQAENDANGWIPFAGFLLLLGFAIIMNIKGIITLILGLIRKS
jgi:hypothetical protein